MKRATVPSILVVVVLLAVGVTAEAQQAKKVPRIGFLTGSGNPFAVEAFRQGLRDLGYTEGKNILIEYRYAERMLDQAPDLVAELVQLKVDVLVSQATGGIRAAKQATKTIPIVMVTVQDPVATGLIDSLARPGGNITGLSRLTVELSGQRLELFKEVVPGISRVGMLWDADGSSIGVKGYEAQAPTLKIQLQSLEVRGPNPDFEGAFQAAAKGGASALITVTGGLAQSLPKGHYGPGHKKPNAFNV